MNRFASVIIEYNSKHVNKTFTYIIPDRLSNLKIGMKVLVPFNKRLINGFVMNISDEYNDVYDLLEIDSIVDEFLVLNEELIELGSVVANSCVCTTIQAFQTMLPSSLKIKSNSTNYNKVIKYIEVVSLELAKEYISNHKNAKKQIEVINELIVNGKSLKSEYPLSIVKVLLDNGIVREIVLDVYRINNDKSGTMKVLTDEQMNVVNGVSFDNFNTNLLYGVTGSGKTEVYMELIKRVLSNGKSAILLVPEITLTTQIISRFYTIFGSDVAVLHSGLSDGEKYDEYLKILRGEARIVIGARSAIFAPLKNIGIIIIDEEHTESYKQDTTPRYHALDIAKWRCKYHDIPLVLGSATPSLESMARAKKGVYNLLCLPNRVNGSLLPSINVVDMNLEIRKGNNYISDELNDSILNCLNRHEQIILLLNRRGHSTTISCSNCGFTHKCPHCDITLTYHKTSNNLRCHYCGFTLFKSDECPECHEKSMNFLGLGTEKLEELLSNKYPSARIVRMDTDTTSKKGAHKKIIDDFANYEYDILLGTQMVSKGLDFPKVTLVGVINADSSLNIPDFRSGERTFSLLNQVSGRAGRGKSPGSVIIQTFNQFHYAIKCLVDNDYMALYNEEMSYRKLLGYPPYYYLTSIKVVSRDYSEASKEISKVKRFLEKNLSPKTVILGPTPASNFRVNNYYRFQIILKYKFDNNLNKCLQELDNLFILNKNCYIEIDVDPLRI